MLDISGKKTHRSVGGRLTVLIILMIAATGAVMMIVGYSMFRNAVSRHYIDLSETLGGIAAKFVDADSLDTYLETGKADSRYMDTLQELLTIRKEGRVLDLYVFRPTSEGFLYVYDTRPIFAGQIGGFDYYDPNHPDFSTQVQKGGAVDPFIGRTVFGWLITVCTPLYGSDGTFKGYVGVDYPMDIVETERMNYLRNLGLIVLLVTILFAAAYLKILHKTIVEPINKIAAAADSFLVDHKDGESSIRNITINTRDELQSLAESLKSMERKTEEYITSLNLITLKSETDPLTKILNREAFQRQVSVHLLGRIDENQMDAFLMIDVDFFKIVNDKYGHTAGDEVLVAFSNTLKKAMRSSDLLGRQGGDEFVVFCKSVGSLFVAERKAKLIREELKKVVPRGGDKHVTASIGISIAPRNGTQFEELYDAADKALYTAKENGRDGYAVY
ncbi:hypothetical protein FACS1894188_04810 [Clostridia bacterium]|nr:hypothetical protein FACS1894188_04810 [Clostridia bacterium]